MPAQHRRSGSVSARDIWGGPRPGRWVLGARRWRTLRQCGGPRSSRRGVGWHSSDPGTASAARYPPRYLRMRGRVVRIGSVPRGGWRGTAFGGADSAPSDLRGTGVVPGTRDTEGGRSLVRLRLGREVSLPRVPEATVSVDQVAARLVALNILELARPDLERPQDPSQFLDPRAPRASGHGDASPSATIPEMRTGVDTRSWSFITSRMAASNSTPRLGASAFRANTNAERASRARVGQSPPTASATANSGSHTSTGRSSTPAGRSGSASRRSANTALP